MPINLRAKCLYDGIHFEKCPICKNEMKYDYTHWDEWWFKYDGYKCIQCGYIIYDK